MSTSFNMYRNHQTTIDITGELVKKLNPCNCGSKNLHCIETISGKFNHKDQQIDCLDCGKHVFQDSNDAVNMWNRRNPISKIIAVVCYADSVFKQYKEEQKKLNPEHKYVHINKPERARGKQFHACVIIEPIDHRLIDYVKDRTK